MSGVCMADSIFNDGGNSGLICGVGDGDNGVVIRSIVLGVL